MFFLLFLCFSEALLIVQGFSQNAASSTWSESSLDQLSLNSSTALCTGSCPNHSSTCASVHQDTCPPGLFLKDQGKCECAKVYPRKMMICNGTRSFLVKFYCATYDEERNLTLFGSCLHIYRKGRDDLLYHLLPRDPYALNDCMCGSYSRTGALCGRCLPDHYPLAYSFNMTCIPCPHARWNWFKYIMAAYLPLTFFYLIILFLKINTTTSHFSAVVNYCQCISMPIFARGIFEAILSGTGTTYIFTTKVIISLYGIWNLDFFRPFYSDLCLGIGILPTLALDYVIAVYPLLLTATVYFLKVLYDENYRVIRILLKPFAVLFSTLGQHFAITIKTSLIDAFATFFFLSNVKFLSVSADLLIPTRVYQLYPDHHNNTLGLYYAGHIEYFGKEHYPYAILAIFMLTVFVLLPFFLLTLYPLSVFQKFLNLFPVRWYVLHTFMDSFQGCYKDGMEPGTRDYRWFASVFFGIRLAAFFMYSSTSKGIVYIILITLCLILHITLFAVLRPFKAAFSHYNVINIMFLQFLIFYTLAVVGSSISKIIAVELVTFFYTLAILFGFCPPFLYVIFLMLRWLCARKKFFLDIFNRIKSRRSGYTLLPEVVSDTLPDRIENSSQYHRRNLAYFSP